MAATRKTTAKIYEIKAHNGNVTCLDLGETGRVLVTGGQDRNVNLWAIGQEECFMSLTDHNSPIDCVRFAYNDDYVYSADNIGIIRRWDLNAQSISTTLYGHMKSVRTLDFNPSGEYVVSGSHDTTVRLWDVRNNNKCIKAYRGHIAQVNSVKFSPDGLWIASAGTEGSVIIWDIRKSKQIMDFTEQSPATAAITCIQFHPYEFLLAVGRIDGTVSIYDLESKARIAHSGNESNFYGSAVKCITFSEQGECLFVGTQAGISVIGWEPYRNFDHIKSTWSAIGDMKIINQRMICGTFEKDIVTINALSVNRVYPFYNPSNAAVAPSAFSHHSTTRRSFSRGNQKLRLSVAASSKPARLVEENEGSQSPSLDEHSSPNLSLELVDETVDDRTTSALPTTTHRFSEYSNRLNSNSIQYENAYNLMTKPVSPQIVPPQFSFPSHSSSVGYSSLGGSAHMLSGPNYDGPTSLKVPGERDLYQFSQPPSQFRHENEYNLNDSNPPIITNYDNTEMVEDFPVNQNSHQQSNGPSSINHHPHPVTNTAHANKPTAKTKAPTSATQRRTAQHFNGGFRSNNTSSQQRGKLSHLSSVSTTELHKLDDNMLLKKSASSNLIGSRSKRTLDTQSQVNKENARNKNISVQIFTPKPPTRSRTSLDLRSPPQQAASQRQSYRISSYTTESNNTTNIPVGYRPDPSLFTHPTSNGHHQRPSNLNGGRQMNHAMHVDDNSEIQMLSVSHEQVYQELSNRHATLQLIRNSTKSHDIVGALKQAIAMNGRTVFVDLLGAILEKTSSWNLDLCLLLLPEIYELLQSQHKFHYTRACDTLRVILSNFLPIIQENIDPWSASGCGVDVVREERQRKCLECQRWLLQIRNISETQHFGTTLTQLQNMIVNI